MRIISGSARGRCLATPPGRDKKNSIRPTSDRAREALFSILGQRVMGSRVLDLFAGTGALGIEAMSRGAKELILVDYHRQALEIIHRNIEICKPNTSTWKVSILKHDLRKGLPASISTHQKIEPFDLIFLDPPYSQELSLKTLEYLSNGRLLSDHGIIVAEERSSESLPDNCGVLILTDQRIYGDTGFWFYTPRHHDENTVKESL